MHLNEKDGRVEVVASGEQKNGGGKIWFERKDIKAFLIVTGITIKNNELFKVIHTQTHTNTHASVNKTQIFLKRTRRNLLQGFSKQNGVELAKDKHIRPGTAVHASNPSTLEGQGGWITWSQEFKTSQASMVKPGLY